MNESKRITLSIVLVPVAVFSVLALILFFTSLGANVPLWLKIGAPIFLYIVTVWFLLAHRAIRDR